MSDEEPSVVTQADDASAVVASFRAGDELALAAVYDRWSPLVYSFALRTLRDVGEAELVTQRVFVQAWASRSANGLPRESTSAWLVGIARHAVDEVRGSRSRQARSGTPLHSGIRMEDDIDPAELSERLTFADEMSRLDVLSSRVLRLALQDDLSHIQIAERTGLPAGTVRGHLSTALVRLRNRLGVLADAH